MELKVPPYSLEAEMAVLGCMMIEVEAQDFALDRLAEPSFYDNKNKLIFQVIAEMRQKNVNIDIVTLVAHLRQAGQLEAIGGAEYLTECANAVPTAAHIASYVEIVEQKCMLRELLKAASKIISEIHGETMQPPEILELAEKTIFKVTQKGYQPTVVAIKDRVHDVVDILEKLHLSDQPVTGLSTGFRKLDEMTSGFQPGNYIILAARPGVGKTSLALNIAQHVVLRLKKPVLFFSLEMSVNEITMRLISAMTKIPLQVLRIGRFKRADLALISKVAEHLHGSPLYIDASNNAGFWPCLRGSARRLKSQLAASGNPLSLICIDYLQLMQSSGRRSDSRQTEIAEISRSIKNLAQDLELPILALSQLNRATEERDGRPRLSDLRESGSLEQDADLVSFIFRESMYSRSTDPEEQKKAKLLIAKQRNGPTGEIDLVFLRELTRFVDPEKEHLATHDQKSRAAGD